MRVRRTGAGPTAVWVATLSAWLVVGASAVAGTGDTDGDALTDLHEFILGTDPFNPDSDFDALQDGAEVNLHGTDPLRRGRDARR